MLREVYRSNVRMYCTVIGLAKNYACVGWKKRENTSCCLWCTTVAAWIKAHWTPWGMTTQGHFVCPGGPSDGRLIPGDQLVKINNVAVDDLTPEQAAEIIRSPPTAAFTDAHTHRKVTCSSYVYITSNINSYTVVFFRECEDLLTITVLRTMLVSHLHFDTWLADNLSII